MGRHFLDGELLLLYHVPAVFIQVLLRGGFAEALIIIFGDFLPVHQRGVHLVRVGRRNHRTPTSLTARRSTISLRRYFSFRVVSLVARVSCHWAFKGSFIRQSHFIFDCYSLRIQLFLLDSLHELLYFRRTYGKLLHIL